MSLPYDILLLYVSTEKLYIQDTPSGFNPSAALSRSYSHCSIHPLHQTNILTLPIEHNSAVKRSVRKNSEIYSHMMHHIVLPSRTKAIEANRQPGILCSDHNLSQKIGHHFFCDAVSHSNFSYGHITAYQIVSDS
jgi:hypothetical protein